MQGGDGCDEVECGFGQRVVHCVAVDELDVCEWGQGGGGAAQDCGVGIDAGDAAALRSQLLREHALSAADFQSMSQRAGTEDRTSGW